jgi:hypothetical protein
MMKTIKGYKITVTRKKYKHIGLGPAWIQTSQRIRAV